MNLVKYFLFFLFLNSCKLPAYEVQKDAEYFAVNNPKAFSTITYQGREIHYAKYGNPEKQPVVFVHGSPGSWEGWVRFLTDPELKTQFYLIAIDRPGFGKSGLGLSEPSIDKQAEALFAVIEIEKLKNPILIGHSLGGAVIARMAMNHPHKIYGLIFVAASVSPELEETKWYQIPANWIGIKQIIPPELRACNEEILALKENLIMMLPLWKKIKSKTVIIHGMKDDLVPVENKDFILQHIDQRSLIEVIIDPDLNHFVPWIKPYLIKSAILKLEKKHNYEP